MTAPGFFDGLLDRAAAPTTRVFLTAWLFFALHFATNITREHYPAFALAEEGTLRVDRYQGFHPDLFEHSDGHWYINNNVGASFVAAVPLLVFDPVLDALEQHRKRQLAANPIPTETYRTKYPLRRAFFTKVRAAGLDLRFGAAAALTSALLMAPLSALSCVGILHGLLRSAVPVGRATWLALLFGFGTPVFFRTGHLSHNLLSMHVVFAAFLLLWPSRDESQVSVARRFLAGMLAGCAVNFDLSGVVPVIALAGYVLACGGPRGVCAGRGYTTQQGANAPRSPEFTRGIRAAIAYTMPFICGGLPLVGFYMLCQWWQFGDPIRPAQAWMKAANFTDQGYQGFSLPAFDLALANLFDPGYGMFTYGPLLALAAIPLAWDPNRPRILPRRERWFVAALFGLFLLFCSANQYARMQWNTGFRYFIPLVPLLFLAAADTLVRLSRGWLTVLSIAVVAHSWVIAMARDTVPTSWERFFGEGIQLAWLNVLRQTRPAGAEGWLGSALLPVAVLLGAAAATGLYWWWAAERTRHVARPAIA